MRRAPRAPPWPRRPEMRSGNRFATRSGGGIYEPNMTPLIDVSLVLVVILMVATPLAFQSSIAVRNAAATGRQAKDLAHTARIELTVHGDGTVGVNRLIVPPEPLAV